MAKMDNPAPPKTVYRATCPHCGADKVSENHTTAVCTIPHTESCPYPGARIVTKFRVETIPAKEAAAALAGEALA